MNKNKAVLDILNEYQTDRQEAERKKSEIMADIRRKIPRVSEIDDLLTLTPMKISKVILSGNISNIKEVEAENKALINERNELIKKAGFKDNYLDNIYKCPLCKDTGYINGEKCSCFKQRLVSRYYSMSSLGPVLNRENFDTFDFRYFNNENDQTGGMSPRERIQAIYQISIEFVREFDKSPKNLFFYGAAGRGKTFMCNCIAKDILDMGKSVLYSSAVKLIKTIEDARFNRENMENPDEQVNFFYTVDLLIIDDLGTEYLTTPTMSAFFDILNSRIQEKKPTIISSNLGPKEIEAQYSDRIVSRLQGEYIFCKFQGEDIRILKKTAFRSG
ncbi:MAG: ATP-binding protein [Clostridiales bacterium]|jgi:DNA replication protein DnaC|nr:ATP-binding protein [Clostridiales bacterium]